MKKLFALLAVALMAVLPAAARDYVTTDSKVLPSTAQTLIKKYYPKVGVNHIKVDKDMLGTDYDVILNNGTELDFDKNGNLKEIDCGMSAVPAGLILKPISTYVAKNFPGQKIVGMSVERNKYSIDLSNGLELEFDRAGNFKRIDD